MKTPQYQRYFAITVRALLVWALALSGAAAAQPLPVVDVVIGNNFGHLPMFVGVEKGLFKKHGVDVHLKVVNTGSDMVSAMQKREVQIGDMSVTTFLKARHGGDSFRVIGGKGRAWDEDPGCCVLEPRLSPDAHAVSVNAPRAAIYSRDSVRVASFVRWNTPVDQLLGWAGSGYVVAVRKDGHVGLVPEVNTMTFIDLGLVLGNPTLVGAIGIA